MRKRDIREMIVGGVLFVIGCTVIIVPIILDYGKADAVTVAVTFVGWAIMLFELIVYGDASDRRYKRRR